ncbi:alpha/beta hydrolase family protein [Agrococcus carbonis]|uniref:KANL3/Tex30 alpha/beta hydrolase-like domain-containing protein n=1 Tax=Agrococcus carbonis TaxID=684552 RepID=A0A1H1RND6_9MICO|nr:alpha/beta family hydrolase [Agrococcus carbonis]SDS37056.1 hypothetical protein SAMN04489719_2166 [Agrococcus carbonis]
MPTARQTVTVPLEGAAFATSPVDRLEAIIDLPDDPWASLVLLHGAGGRATQPWMEGAAAGLADAGVAVLRASFPNAEAGRGQPEPAKRAVASWHAIMAVAREALPHEPWAGGKSFGGRMAAHAVAAGMPATGLIYLGYPLHPPGRPERLRTEHLAAIALPQRFLQGTNDPFQSGALLDDLVATLPEARIDWVDGGDHSFLVAGGDRDQPRVARALAPRITALLRD